MHRPRRNETNRRLAALSHAERERLYKRALKLRGAARKRKGAAGERRRTKTRSWVEWMEEGSAVYERSHRSGGRSLNDWMMKLLGEESSGGAGEQAGSATPDVRRGTVLQIAPGACTVSADGALIRCVLPAEIASLQQSELAVGDAVTFRPGVGDGLVTGVLPRGTVLSRPDPLVAGRERVIAANLDVVVIVVSVKSPPLKVRLIDRCLIAVQRGGASPLVCVNKIDLLSEDGERAQEKAKLEPYRPAGVPIAFASAETGEGLDILREWLRAKRCAFIGHSGVGKSSLLNALDPSLRAATGPVSEATARGTHTTTVASLYRLAGGTEVIDTPGVRAFGLWRIERRELPWYFPEFEPFARACRFRNCSHAVEPDCAVKEAVRCGEIAGPRYDTYRRILGTLGGRVA